MKSGVTPKFTGISLKQVILKFIPHQFIENLDLSKLGFDNPEVLLDGGVGLLSKLIEKSNFETRMFGTPEDFAKCLYSYQNFTSSHRYFEMDITEEYQTTPMMYRSLSKTEFNVKQDLLVEIQHSLFSHFPKAPRLSRSVIMIFIKTCETKLNNSFEFVRRDPSKLLFNMENFDDLSEECCSEFDFDEIYNTWKSWIPDWTDEQYQPIRMVLQKHFEKFPYSKNKSDFHHAAAHCKRMLGVLQQLISSNSNLFLPYTKENIKFAPLVVRVFVSLEHKFVMRSELFRVINQKNNTEWEYEDPNGFVLAMDFDQVEETFGQLLPNVEYVHIPIQGLGDVSTPVMAPNGDHCIMGESVIGQLFDSIFFQIKALQKDHPQFLDAYMEWLIPQFEKVENLCYFITMDKFDYLNNHTFECFNDLNGIPTKTIRNIRKNVGFSVHDVKKELKHLGMMEECPWILDCAEVVYKQLGMSNVKRYSKTSDMFRALRLTQLSYMKCKYPESEHIFSLGKKTTPSPCYMGTKWKEYNMKEVRTIREYQKNYGKLFLKSMICSNDVKLYSSIHLPFSCEDSWKEFILDEEDKKHIYSDPGFTSEYLRDIDTFTKYRPEKRFYIRLTPTDSASEQDQTDETKLAFKEDAIDIIKLILKKQGVTNEFDEKTISLKFQSEHGSLTLAQVKEICDEFDVNKNWITIVTGSGLEIDAMDEVHGLDSMFGDKSDDSVKEDEELTESNTESHNAPEESTEIASDASVSVQPTETQNAPEVKLQEEDSCQNCHQLTKQIEDIVLSGKEELSGCRAMLEECTSTSRQQEEQIKRQSIALANSDKKIEILKSKLSRYEDNEDILRETNKKLTESKSQLAKRVTNLECQLNTEKQKTQKVEQEGEQQRIDASRKLSVLQSEFDKEVMTNKPIHEEYSKKIKQLEAQLQLATDSKSELSETVRKLEAALASRSTEMEVARQDFRANIRVLEERVSDSTQLELQLAQKSSEIAELNRRVEDCLKTERTYGREKGRLENLVASYRTDNAELRGSIHDLKIEKRQLESLLDKERNRMGTTSEPGVKDPEFVDLQKVNQELRNTNHRLTGQIEQQNLVIKGFFDRLGPSQSSYASSSTQTAESDNAEDLECLICLNDMTSDEKTLKCESCRKVFHLECASQWLKKHRSCPQCRRELLDPTEFPALG